MSDQPKKHVPADRDPEQLPGSPDAGIAPEWPHRTYNDERSAVHGDATPQQDDGSNTGKKTE